MPLYSDNAPAGYMGDPKRGAAIGRTDIAPYLAAAELRTRLAHRVAARDYLRDYSADMVGSFGVHYRRELAKAESAVTELQAELDALASVTAAPVKVTLQRVPLTRGGYDSCGTYWGIGQPLYWSADESGEYVFTFRAADRDHAKAIVRETFPNARFAN
jgi:hypothetical protein